MSDRISYVEFEGRWIEALRRIRLSMLEGLKLESYDDLSDIYHPVYGLNGSYGIDACVHRLRADGLLTEEEKERLLLMINNLEKDPEGYQLARQILINKIEEDEAKRFRS